MTDLIKLFEQREDAARKLKDAFLTGADRNEIAVYEHRFRTADAAYRHASNEYDAKQRGFNDGRNI